MRGPFKWRLNSCKVHFSKYLHEIIKQIVGHPTLGSVGYYCSSISKYVNNKHRGMLLSIYKWKIDISTALFDCRAEERRDREKTWRRKTGHTDLKGFSPYITVRSTLQPPLERECVVNTPVLAFSLHSHWLQKEPSKLYVLTCKIQANEKKTVITMLWFH